MQGLGLVAVTVRARPCDCLPLLRAAVGTNFFWGGVAGAVAVMVVAWPTGETPPTALNQYLPSSPLLPPCAVPRQATLELRSALRACRAVGGDPHAADVRVHRTMAVRSLISVAAAKPAWCRHPTARRPAGRASAWQGTKAWPSRVTHAEHGVLLFPGPPHKGTRRASLERIHCEARPRLVFPHVGVRGHVGVRRAVSAGTGSPPGGGGS